MEKYLIPTENNTKKLAIELSSKINKGDIILLYGNLGIGKTYFTRCLIKALTNETEIVPSPTFTIIQTYQTQKGELSHYDLYRIKDKEELIEIGLYESLKNNITIIEWPEIIEDYITKNYHPIKIYFNFEKENRTISIIK